VATRVERCNVCGTVTDLMKFAFFSGVLFLVAWVAGTGRVAYTLIMLVVAAALVFAVLDLLDYQMVKRKKPDRDPA
jgi:hypothetical protein